MPEPELVFEYHDPENGNLVRTATPDEFETWRLEEFAKWQWLDNSGLEIARQIYQRHKNFHRSLDPIIVEWRKVAQARPNEVPRIFEQMLISFRSTFNERTILLSNSPEGVFVLNQKDNKGYRIGVGAYAAIIGMDLPSNSLTTQLIEGIWEGFLYRRSINWLGQAHSQVLADLRARYTQEMLKQEERSKVIEDTNKRLNEKFEAELNAYGGEFANSNNDFKTQLAEQQKQFEMLLQQNDDTLKDIRKTYDADLALRKPVEYWENKEAFHQERAQEFSWAVSVTAFVVIGLLGAFAYNTFFQLKPEDNPRHWQVAVLVIATFFSIWLIRVLIKILFSHLHLSTDAAERRMIILTYISMVREGKDIAPDDKKVIFQHIFRSASDGFVKDDSTPPGLYELLSRFK